MTNYFIAALVFALVAVAAYAWYQIRNLKADIGLDKVDNEKAFEGLTDLVTELNKARQKQITDLEEATPRYRTNSQNEAILTSPDGKELFNYDLKTKK